MIKYIISCLILFFSCSPSFRSKYDERVIKKKGQDSVLKLEWYTFTAAHSTFPDYIVVDSNDLKDTLCTCDNIADVVLTNKQILIKSYGRPKLYDSEVKVRDLVFGYKIMIDSSLKKKL